MFIYFYYNFKRLDVVQCCLLPRKLYRLTGFVCVHTRAFHLCLVNLNQCENMNMIS